MLTKSMMESLINTGNKDIKVIINYLKDEGYTYDNIEEWPENIATDINQYIIDTLLTNISLKINEKNTIVSNAIKWYIDEGYWTNLIQIRRALLNDIDDCLRLIPYSSRIKTMKEVNQLDREWDNLSKDDKKRLLDSLKV